MRRAVCDAGTMGSMCWGWSIWSRISSLAIGRSRQTSSVRQPESANKCSASFRFLKWITKWKAEKCLVFLMRMRLRALTVRGGAARLKAVVLVSAFLFPGSSTVEHSAVNRRVASSNLARGANSLFMQRVASIFRKLCALAMKCQVHESRLISINEDEGKSTRACVFEVDQLNRDQPRSIALKPSIRFATEC